MEVRGTWFHIVFKSLLLIVHIELVSVSMFLSYLAYDFIWTDTCLCYRGRDETSIL